MFYNESRTWVKLFQCGYKYFLKMSAHFNNDAIKVITLIKFVTKIVIKYLTVSLILPAKMFWFEHQCLLDL